VQRLRDASASTSRTARSVAGIRTILEGAAMLGDAVGRRLARTCRGRPGVGEASDGEGSGGCDRWAGRRTRMAEARGRGRGRGRGRRRSGAGAAGRAVMTVATAELPEMATPTGAKGHRWRQGRIRGVGVGSASDGDGRRQTTPKKRKRVGEQTSRTRRIRRVEKACASGSTWRRPTARRSRCSCYDPSLTSVPGSRWRTR
jgi:hypothetical protein